MAGENFTNFIKTNLTSPYYHYYGHAFVVPMCFIMSLAMLLAVGGNVMVILTIVRHRNMRTRTNMFIVSLAVADILVAVCDMPFSIITLIKGDWVFGDAFCAFNGVTMALFLVASIQTLTFISVHKYISITRPFSRFMTPRRIMGMIAFTWLWSLIYAVGGASGWSENVYKTGASQCGPTYPKTKTQISHSIVNTLVNYSIPLMVMCFCYTNIFCEIRRHMSRMRENTNIDMQNSIMQQKRITVTLFVVLVCFLVCWSPYIVYSCYAAFVKNKSSVPVMANPLVRLTHPHSNPQTMTHTRPLHIRRMLCIAISIVHVLLKAYWCGYINSACNPIIYAFRSPSFRQGYYSIVCGTKPRNYYHSGSFSQRSPSFRKRSIHNNVNNTLPLGQNGESVMDTTARPSDETTRVTATTTTNEDTDRKLKLKSKKNHKRPKRLLSMDSWASIRLPSLARQWSVHSPLTGPIQASTGPPVFPQPPSDAAAAAGGDATHLSPIMEGSQEDVSQLAVKVAVDIGCNVAFSDPAQRNEYI